MSNLTFETNHRNGIEFYVSSDSRKTGMSGRGLARCCGVSRQSIVNILDGVSKSSNHFLSPYANNIYIDTGGSDNVENNAKIISSIVCAKIIEYYAYTSKTASNDIAKQTFSKFAICGIDNWIKDAVGYIDEKQSNNNLSTSDIADKLSLILQEVQIVRKTNDELRPLAINYIKVKDGVRAQFPGLDNILDAIEEEKSPKLLPGTKVTLSDWVRSKKITLNNGGYCALGRMVSECYKTMRREEPKKGNRKKSNGKWSMNVRLYSEQDFPILESALEQYMSSIV